MQKGGKEINYQNVGEDERTKLFEAALSETSLVMRARKEEWYSYCGRNCPDLTVDRMSVNSQENFADWMAFKALGRYLQRKQNLRDRREAAALSMALFCEKPGPRNDAHDLAAAENKYSLEVHPDDRLRRLSVFNKRNAELTQCLASE